MGIVMGQPEDTDQINRRINPDRSRWNQRSKNFGKTKSNTPDRRTTGSDCHKETPSSNFYSGLGSLKGVDMTTASLGFHYY